MSSSTTSASGASTIRGHLLRLGCDRTIAGPPLMSLFGLAGLAVLIVRAAIVVLARDGGYGRARRRRCPDDPADPAGAPGGQVAGAPVAGAADVAHVWGGEPP